MPARAPARDRRLPGVAGTLAIFLLSFCVVYWLHGCEGEVGRCSGGDCPGLPGCEDNPITCDVDHICMEQVCEGVGWICGMDDQGTYAWFRHSAPCDDNKVCTSKDICAGGRCTGTPKPCNTPKANYCIDANNLRVFDAKGLCQNGTCLYPYKDHRCSSGCQGGKCTGAPCTGITCKTPPGTCYSSPGTCASGKCTYTKKPKGTPCTQSDKCVSGAACDDAGKCVGATMGCSRPHATGGTCVSGSCQGFQCTAGWGNCNTTWSDGCETPLNTSTHCGKCKSGCPSVPNGTPGCSAGKCVVASCTAPWADCDKSITNGCERKVGVPHTCSKSGEGAWSGSAPPCGTAYCGSSTDSKAANFGSWYCIWCTHCNTKPNGHTGWCLPSSGKYSSQDCDLIPSCGCSPENKTCPK